MASCCWPRSTANINGVVPLEFIAFTFTSGFAQSASTICVCAVSIALCSGVFPVRSPRLKFTPAHWVRNETTSGFLFSTASSSAVFPSLSCAFGFHLHWFRKYDSACTFPFIAAQCMYGFLLCGCTAFRSGLTFWSIHRNRSFRWNWSAANIEFLQSTPAPMSIGSIGPQPDAAAQSATVGFVPTGLSFARLCINHVKISWAPKNAATLMRRAPLRR